MFGFSFISECASGLNPRQSHPLMSDELYSQNPQKTPVK